MEGPWAVGPNKDCDHKTFESRMVTPMPANRGLALLFRGYFKADKSVTSALADAADLMPSRELAVCSLKLPFR